MSVVFHAVTDMDGPQDLRGPGIHPLLPLLVITSEYIYCGCNLKHALLFMNSNFV